ncbi:MULTISPECIES: mycolate reductase [Corynebacterium]|uniref:SDR family oxidoreductase n=1 Tax=Corynebacterium lipophilum TaxID=2804918 RepID=A0AAW5HW37_9CORY|nr:MULTISPECIES: mycolate reductase [Corynebacterium]MCO6394502.1 SDR family oxidoreductase [Corynebacterium lipophilum]MCZ2117499.1 mycolate reductase [Corynebacterium lipophilum]OIR43036.1 short-chain dehydrogenase [Corynebacterium sp. NML120713]
MTFPSPTTDSFALITGASQGIGEAVARQLAAAGYNVLLVARREAVLMQLANELAQAHGINAEVFAADLSKERDVTALLDYIGQKKITICVNSAGIASFGPFMKQDWNYETDQFNLNATAVFRITKAVLDQMVPRGEGSLCNVGSAAGNMPIPNNATYVFTKAGVNTFTEALHYELKDSGVHCTLLAPGPVREAEVPEEEQSIVDKVVPDFLWTTYESCAKDTISAMRSNKRRVVPGPLSKVMDFVSTYAPRGALAPIMGRFYAKMGEE